MLLKKYFFGIEIIHKKPQLLKLQYILGATILKRNSLTKVIEFNRKRFFINGVEPSRLFDQLAERCMSVIYPIQIELSKENRMISIPNLEIIQRRWRQEMKVLSHEYKGEIIDNYFQQINENISNQEKFIKSMQSDVSYILLFAKSVLFGQGININDEVAFSFPINGYKKNTYFNGLINLRSDTNDNNIYYFKGVDNKKGSLNLDYYFNDNILFVNKIKGTFFSDDLKKEIDYRITYLKNCK
jgi:hypothetical protein